MTWSEAFAWFGWSLLALCGVAAVALVLAEIWIRKGAKKMKPNRRATDPLEAGERVRFLCAIPELGIEAGEEGRIYMIYPGDDREYWIAPDRDTSKRTKIFDYELWQIERI